MSVPAFTRRIKVLQAEALSAIVLRMHEGGTARFPSEFRLKKRTDFKRVYEDGTKRVGRYFSLFILPTGREGRIGIVVSRRFGKAVERNRIKRLIREAYRLNRAKFVGMDLVVIPRERCKGKDAQEIERALITEVTEAALEVKDGEGSHISDEKRVRADEERARTREEDSV